MKKIILLTLVGLLSTILGFSQKSMFIYVDSTSYNKFVDGIKKVSNSFNKKTYWVKKNNLSIAYVVPTTYDSTINLGSKELWKDILPGYIYVSEVKNGQRVKQYGIRPGGNVSIPDELLQTIKK